MRLNQYIDENKKQSELLSQRTKLVAMGEMIENIAYQWRQPLSLDNNSIFWNEITKKSWNVK